MSTSTPAPEHDTGIQLSPELDAVLRAAERSALVREVAELREVVAALQSTHGPAVAAASRWDSARAACLEAIVEAWRYQVGPARVGPSVLLLLATSGCLGGLSVAGIEVDLGELADAAAHWWSGQPHRVECEPDMPIDPAPMEAP